MADKEAFWKSITVLAAAFREEAPQIIGKLRQMVDYFDSLDQEQQVQLRLDVQLLCVQFAKLALVMTNKLDDEQAK